MYHLISRIEASRALGVSYNQIPNLCEKYGLQRIQIGGKWMFDKKVIEQFIERNIINPNNKKPEVIN